MKGGGCAEGKNLSAEMLIDTDLLVVSTRVNIYILDFYIDIGNDREKKSLKISKNTRKLWEKRFVEILTRRGG